MTNRRTFSKQLALGLGMGMIAPAFKHPYGRRLGRRRTIKPHRLKKGDTIGLITPGSYISDENLQKAVTNLESLGFGVKMAKNIRAKRGFNAGTDQQRLEDLHAMFADETVAGVWCARGGYGCSRLLPSIDFGLIKKHPKVLIGYSDVTALLAAIFLKTGLLCFHGPVGASDFTDYSVEHFEAVVMNPVAGFRIATAEESKLPEAETHSAKVITGGVASGQIAGGNLSLLAALAGTDYEPDFKNKIVLMEDIGEKPYRIDRMLTQLRQSYRLREAAGIALGLFVDCEADIGADSLSLMEVLEDRLSGLGVPVVYGFPFGHISNQVTFPIGLKAVLNAVDKSLELVETAVV